MVFASVLQAQPGQDKIPVGQSCKSLRGANNGNIGEKTHN
jgi:hypothetical protein